MSILAQKLDEVRNAATIAKKLSPAMVRAMTAPSFTDQDGIWPREWVVANETAPGSLTVYAKVNTTVALMQRELLAGGRHNEAGNVGHDFTDLGLLVRDVLVRGAEVLLEETLKAYADQKGVLTAGIIAKLSESQRDAIVSSPSGNFCQAQGPVVLNALIRQGLAIKRYDLNFALTTLGRAVHAVLTDTTDERRAELADVQDQLERKRQLGLTQTEIATLSLRRTRLEQALMQQAVTEPMRQQPQQQQQAQDAPETPARELLDPHHLHLAYLMPERLRRLLMAAHPSVGAMVCVPRASIMKPLVRAGVVETKNETWVVGKLTELGLAVHHAVAELWRIGVLSTTRTPLRHQILAQVVRGFFQTIAQVDSDDREFRGEGRASSFFLKGHEVKCLTDLLRMGWIESKPRRQNPNGPAPVRLTEAGMRCLMTWDGAYGRLDLPDVESYTEPQHHRLASIPPENVINALPTKETVKQYPDYYIPGPGRVVADRVLCDHGYHLTDSCPCC